MTETEKILLIGSNVLIVFTMILIGGISYIRTRKFLDNAIAAKGKVIQMVSKGSAEDGSSMVSPKIEFTTQTGQVVQFTEKWSSNRPDYKVGDEAPIYYDPQNPANAKLAQKKYMMFFIAYLIGGMGLLFLFIGIMVLVLFTVLPK